MLDSRWRAAGASGGGNCVQARAAGGGAEVRDSKDPAGPVLTFTRSEWAAFLTAVKTGAAAGA